MNSLEDPKGLQSIVKNYYYKLLRIITNSCGIPNDYNEFETIIMNSYELIRIPWDS